MLPRTGRLQFLAYTDDTYKDLRNVAVDFYLGLGFWFRLLLGLRTDNMKHVRKTGELFRMPKIEKSKKNYILF